MKRLFIEPLDVLMFRSERPFIARESHVAKLGVISPLTFEGAIKSKIFLDFCNKKSYLASDFQRKKNENESKFKKRVKNMLEKDGELKEILKVIGHPIISSTPSIRVLGVFFSEKDKKEECFPIPNDIVRRDIQDDEILKLNPILEQELRIPNTENYVCFSVCSKIKGIKGLMSFNALKEYLWGGKPDKSQMMEDPYETEVRTGIRLEKRVKTTIEGHIYTAEFLRLKENWGFIVWVEEDHGILNKYLDENEIIKLGGEGKGALCMKINEIDIADKLEFPELVEKINKEKRFKLYLASPSYFNGHKPPRDKLEKELKVKELKLRAALPGKPVYIGGYDFAMNMEKPLRRWVNAGAVYYYEFSGEIKNDVSLPIKIIDENVDMRCAFIGRW